MGLVNKKVKVTTRDWCEDFYSNTVFSTIRDIEFWQVFCNTSYEKLVETDPTFSIVDPSNFANQLLALWLEVIGIAWLLHVKDDFLPLQSEGTRLFLLKRNRSDLWDMMEAYNQSVEESTTGGIDSATRKGQKDIAAVNLMRVNIFDKWVTKVSDPQDAARPANRIGCQTSWESERTPIYLSFALTRQLQCEINDEGRMKIQSIIHGFFDGASENLRSKTIIVKSELVHEADGTLVDKEKSSTDYPSEERPKLKKKQLGGWSRLWILLGAITLIFISTYSFFLTTVLLIVLATQATAFLYCVLPTIIGAPIKNIDLGSGRELFRIGILSIHLFPFSGSVSLYEEEIPDLEGKRRFKSEKDLTRLQKGLVYLSGPILLFCGAALILGTESFSLLISGFGQIIKGAISPIEGAQTYFAAYESYFNDHNLLQVFSLIAIKMVALSLLPLLPASGGQALTVFVFGTNWSDKPGLMAMTYIGLVLWALIVGSWSIGFINYCFLST